jgi:hypothetical protein
LHQITFPPWSVQPQCESRAHPGVLLPCLLHSASRWSFAASVLTLHTSVSKHGSPHKHHFNCRVALARTSFTRVATASHGLTRASTIRGVDADMLDCSTLDVRWCICVSCCSFSRACGGIVSVCWKLNPSPGPSTPANLRIWCRKHHTHRHVCSAWLNPRGGRRSRCLCACLPCLCGTYVPRCSRGCQDAQPAARPPWANTGRGQTPAIAQLVDTP